MTKIPESLIEQVPTWDFETVYEHFDLLEPELRIKKKVEEGIKLRFPVEIIIEGTYEEFPRTKKVRVLGMGLCDFFEFKREIRKRKKLMLQYIYENYNQETTVSRIDLENEEEET